MVQITTVQKKLLKATQMAKTWDYRGSGKKGSFGQKKRNLQEMEDLKSSGYYDMLSNRQRINTSEKDLEDLYG